jgi:peptide/nickel transport system ATP-binding protein
MRKPVFDEASPLLEVRDLRIEGQSDDSWHEIVKGVSFDLKRGEVLGLIGESGAGKSTIGLASIGYVRPGCRIKSGQVRYKGIDLVSAKDRDKRALWGAELAYVAQSAAAAFNPAHRLIEQCQEPAVIHGERGEKKLRDRIVGLFRKLSLPQPEALGERYPHQLSGGQLQRVMTAMAMSCHPGLLIFDEPTTALDVTTQIEVLATIKQIVHEFGVAAIYITHDLAVVSQVADRIIVLRYGEVVEEAPTTKMLSAPEAAYTKSLWAVRKLDKQEDLAAKPILHLRDVDAGYGKSIKILDKINLAVPRGRTVAVVGESGSGKSTLARTIMGLQPAFAGSIEFDGVELPLAFKQRSGLLHRRIQMIYQSPDTALNPRRRVRDILSRPLQRHLGLSGEARRQRVAELMSMVELNTRLLDRFPSELSGGEKQRVCIARALAVEPELIICDEVTSALDQIVAEGVLKLLLRLQQQIGITYIFITHDLATVRAISDWIVVMHRGEIVEQGPKSQIMTPPRHAYTELLFSSMPEMDPAWLPRVLRERQSAGTVQNVSAEMSM